MLHAARTHLCYRLRYDCVFTLRLSTNNTMQLGLVRLAPAQTHPLPCPTDRMTRPCPSRPSAPPAATVSRDGLPYVQVAVDMLLPRRQHRSQLPRQLQITMSYNARVDADEVCDGDGEGCTQRLSLSEVRKTTSASGSMQQLAIAAAASRK